MEDNKQSRKNKVHARCAAGTTEEDVVLKEQDAGSVISKVTWSLYAGRM